MVTAMAEIQLGVQPMRHVHADLNGPRLDLAQQSPQRCLIAVRRQADLQLLPVLPDRFVSQASGTSGVDRSGLLNTRQSSHLIGWCFVHADKNPRLRPIGPPRQRIYCLGQ